MSRRADSVQLGALLGLLIAVTAAFLAAAIRAGGFADRHAIIVGPIDPITALELGALAPWGVTRHQLDRILSAAFIHAGLGHWICNVSLLFFAGSLWGGRCGAASLLVIALAAQATAGIATLVWSDFFVVVGASGGVFGVFAAVAVIDWLHPESLPATLARTRKARLVVSAAIVAFDLLLWAGAALSLWQSQAVHVAHFAGLLGGGLLALLLLWRRDPAALRAGSLPWLRPAAIGALAVICLSVAVSARRAFVAGDPGTLRALARWMDSGDISTTRLNEVATVYALVPTIDRSLLVSARDAMLRAGVSDGPGEGVRLSTLAALEYRLGDQEEAAAYGARALAEGHLDEKNERIVTSLLARIGDALVSGSGDSSRRVGAESPGPAVRLRSGADGTRALDVELERPATAGLTLYAVLRAPHSLEGLLRIQLGPTQERRWSFDDNGSTLARLPAGTELRIFRVADGAPGLAPGGWSWRVWRMDPRVERLPGPLADRSMPVPAGAE